MHYTRPNENFCGKCNLMKMLQYEKSKCLHVLMRFVLCWNKLHHNCLWHIRYADWRRGFIYLFLTKLYFCFRSTLDVFDPRPAQSTPVCHCLTDLLSHISPQFKHNLGTLRHRWPSHTLTTLLCSSLRFSERLCSYRPSLPAEEMLSTPYRTHSWLGVSSLHLHRSSFSCRLGLDQDLNAQVHTHLSHTHIFQCTITKLYFDMTVWQTLLQ